MGNPQKLRRMKKVLIILASIIGFFLIILLLLPIFLKGNITGIIEKQSAKYLKADLKIGSLDLNMFSSFPDLNVALKDVVVTGHEQFSGDTLVAVPLFEASVNVMSVIRGDEIVVNKVLLKEALLDARIAADGQVNWDIVKSDGGEELQPEAVSDTVGAPSGSIQLKSIVVEQLTLRYSDEPSDMYAGAGPIDLNLHGNFAESNTSIEFVLALRKIFFRQGNTVWLNNLNADWNADIAANFADMAFEFRKSTLSLNDLLLELTGKIAMTGEKIGLDMLLKAPDTRFESLLALIPQEFRQQMEGVQMAGDFNLNMQLAGEYCENHLPAFDLKFGINNASVRYPDLPEAIDKIRVDLNVTNPGGSSDNTLIDLSRLSFVVAGNPFDMHLKVANLSDPDLKGGAQGSIDFGSLKKAVPMEGITLEGGIGIDLVFDGKYQYIEKEQYEKFMAKGTISAHNILFKNEGFPEGISVPGGSVTITPARLNLNDLKAKINSSDFLLKGYVANYLPYVLKNETLKGSFILVSNRIDANEFLQDLPAEDSAVTDVAADTAPMEAVVIPANIDLQLTTNIQTVLYDRLEINRIKGNIRLLKGVADLSNLSMDLLEGNMVMNGKYDSSKPDDSGFDFRLKMSGLDIHSAYNSFSVVKEMVPVALNCQGKFSADIRLDSRLDKTMSPVMNTLNGSGNISSQGLLINENPTLEKLSSILKNEELSRLSVSSLNVNFKIEKGNVIVEPFQTTLAGNPTTFSGTQSVDGKMDYTISMNVSRDQFGGDINNLLKNIPGSDKVQSVDLDVKIGGTIDKPTVTPDLSKAIKALTKSAEEELKNKAKEELKKQAQKGLESLFKKR